MTSTMPRCPRCGHESTLHVPRCVAPTTDDHARWPLVECACQHLDEMETGDPLARICPWEPEILR